MSKPKAPEPEVLPSKKNSITVLGFDIPYGAILTTFISLVVLVWGAAAAYFGLVGRIDALENSNNDSQMYVVKELPAIVDRSVDEKLKRENTIQAMLENYTCVELLSHQADIQNIKELKRCPK